MKLKFTIILQFISIFGFCQNGNYIVREDGLWSTLEIHCMPNGNNFSTYFIKFMGDTVIDDLQYKKAWYSQDEDY